jgi:drug/metabolite transporter (DMT)-like permease
MIFMSATQRLFLMLLLTCMWSPSFLFIKLALEDLAPLTIAAGRVSIATLALSCILCIRKIKLPKDARFWFRAAVMAILASAVPFFCFAYAEQSIDSALAAIINGTSPMFTLLFAFALFPSDRLTGQKLIGVFLSAFGLILLFAPNIINGLSGTFSGILAATIASISYSLSHIWGKKYFSQQKPFVAPTAQLLMASIFLVPLALYFEAPFAKSFPSATALTGVLGLACFGTTLAFILYYKLLEVSGPTAISTVACFFPVGAMLLGFFFLGETLSPTSIVASLLILLGLFSVNEVIKLPVRS